MTPIVDLHCDLLSFLTKDKMHTYQNPSSNCSYEQMQKGGVTLQTLAIFTERGKGSLAAGKKQVDALHSLVKEHPNHYRLWDPSIPIEATKEAIFVTPAFENGCSFSEEEEPIKTALDYLESLRKNGIKPLYISLTWDGENRFGGGCGSKTGLKEDGKRLLEWMDKKKIAVDLSHASDFLADNILNYIDKKSFTIPLMASHSNARSIENKERNLPDFLIHELVSRKGLIGLNFFAPFIGKRVEDIAKHVAHFLSLGAENHLAFGADFFPTLDAEYIQKKYQSTVSFFSKIGNSSCYPSVLSLLETELNLPIKTLKKLANENFSLFLKEHSTH